MSSGSALPGAMNSLAGRVAGSSTDLYGLEPEAHAPARRSDDGDVRGPSDSEAPPASSRAGTTAGSYDATGEHAQSASEEEETEEAYALPPWDIKLERPRTEAEIARDLATVRGMWEMAAVLDFLTLFKPQLKIARDFGPDELEHVLVASAGDGGLLADVHAALLRGISPKSSIDPANWAVHLANKIKFYWRGAPGGAPCPFKPEKYYESVAYAGLPVEQRVRALHFICCVRVDRDDCAARVEEALRPRTRRELAEAEAAREAARSARPTRGSRAAAAAYKPPEDVDSFRRAPVGVEASGAALYYLESEGGTVRLYREEAVVVVPEEEAGSRGEVKEEAAGSQAEVKEEAKSRAEVKEEPGVNATEGSIKLENGDGKEDGASIEGARGRGRDREERSSPASSASPARPASPRITRSGKRPRDATSKPPPPPPLHKPLSRAKRRAALLAYELPPEPPAPAWALAASTLQELEDLGRRLRRSAHGADRAVADTLLEELAPIVAERQAAEARRLRAAERVARRLGDPAASWNAPDGRARRERKPVNYAFTDFDDVMRSAIRRTQRGDEEEEEAAARRRHGAAPACDPVAEAQAGLRRGRSAAPHTSGTLASDPIPDISERELRLARKAEAERLAQEAEERRLREEEEARLAAEEERKRREREEAARRQALEWEAARRAEAERLAAEEEARAKQVDEARRRAREARARAQAANGGVPAASAQAPQYAHGWGGGAGAAPVALPTPVPVTARYGAPLLGQPWTQEPGWQAGAAPRDGGNVFQSLGLRDVSRAAAPPRQDASFGAPHQAALFRPAAHVAWAGAQPVAPARPAAVPAIDSALSSLDVAALSELLRRHREQQRSTAGGAGGNGMP